MCNDFLYTIKYEERPMEDVCVQYQKDKQKLHKLLDDELKKTIDAFNGVIHIPINKKDLGLFEFGRWYELNDKVRVKRRKQRFHSLLCFDTEVEEGGEFGRHFHEDLIESCDIVYGEMKDLEDGEIYREGDIMEYGKGKEHQPIALKKTKLHVLFKP
mgnify:CR=1 FL=1